MRLITRWILVVAFAIILIVLVGYIVHGIIRPRATEQSVYPLPLTQFSAAPAPMVHFHMLANEFASAPGHVRADRYIPADPQMHPHALAPSPVPPPLYTACADPVEPLRLPCIPK